MGQIEFAHPKYFYLLLFLIPMVVWYFYRLKKRQANIQISTIEPLTHLPSSAKIYFRHLPVFMRLIAIVLLIIILARPQSTNKWENTITEGIDIVLALDISSSMLAMDFKPDRLEASKDVAVEFISGRPNDRIGLVIFSAESFTQCPLTTDRAVLINLFKDIQSGMVEDGTAIGVGLANAIARLKDSDAKSKVIILLTDGINNRGAIDPLTAAELAKSFGIRVYTIGIGTIGKAKYPIGKNPWTGQMVYQDVPVEIDESTLQQISDMTNGRYFRATNNQKLREIYAEIDKLEKSKIDVKEYSKKTEEYSWYAFAATFLLIGEVLINKSILRKIP